MKYALTQSAIVSRMRFFAYYRLAELVKCVALILGAAICLEVPPCRAMYVLLPLHIFR